ncbi:hypothetical protein ACPWR0_22175 [Pandoraea pneumonica]|uniref:hypothetical protein n=1 Tax=Pandoraea pneumonica TaxID=2508299 RepID=UPI003CEA73A3
MNPHALPSQAATPVLGRLDTNAAGTVFQCLPLKDLISARAAQFNCAQTRDAIKATVLDPNSVAGKEIRAYVERHPGASELTRNASQLRAICELVVSRNDEITVDLLRDTGLPEALASDLNRRLQICGPEWTIANRLAAYPSMEAWIKTALERETPAAANEDLLTLRILQTFGYNVALPWQYDLGTRHVLLCADIYSRNYHINDLIHLAIHRDEESNPRRLIARNVCEAIISAQHKENGELWPNWVKVEDEWQVREDPSSNAIRTPHAGWSVGATPDTMRWLLNMDMAGAIIHDKTETNRRLIAKEIAQLRHH